MTVVWVTHDIFQARRAAGRVAFLLGGRLIEASSAATFFTAPQTKEATAFLRGDLVYAEEITNSAGSPVSAT